MCCLLDVSVYIYTAQIAMRSPASTAAGSTAYPCSDYAAGEVNCAVRMLGLFGDATDGQARRIIILRAQYLRTFKMWNQVSRAMGVYLLPGGHQALRATRPETLS